MRRTDLAADGVAGLEIELANLRGRNVDVVGAGQIVVVGGAQKAVAVGQDFEHAFGKDVAFFFALGLKDFENQVLLAQSTGAGQVQRSGDLGQLRNVFFFQFSDGHYSIHLRREIFKGGLLRKDLANHGAGGGAGFTQPAVVPRRSFPVPTEPSAVPSLQSYPEPHSWFPGFWCWACETYGSPWTQAGKAYNGSAKYVKRQ